MGKITFNGKDAHKLSFNGKNVKSISVHGKPLTFGPVLDTKLTGGNGYNNGKNDGWTISPKGNLAVRNLYVDNQDDNGNWEGEIYSGAKDIHAHAVARNMSGWNNTQMGWKNFGYVRNPNNKIFRIDVWLKVNSGHNGQKKATSNSDGATNQLNWLLTDSQTDTHASNNFNTNPFRTINSSTTVFNDDYIISVHNDPNIEDTTWWIGTGSQTNVSVDLKKYTPNWKPYTSNNSNNYSSNNSKSTPPPWATTLWTGVSYMDGDKPQQMFGLFVRKVKDIAFGDNNAGSGNNGNTSQDYLNWTPVDENYQRLAPDDYVFCILPFFNNHKGEQGVSVVVYNLTVEVVYHD